MAPTTLARTDYAMHTHDTRIERRPRWGTSSFALLSFGALLCASLAAACGDKPGGPPTGPVTDNDQTRPLPRPGEYGAACDTAADCDDTECIILGVGSDDAFCSLRCATDDDCPDDGVSSCLSISNQDGLVRICQPSDLCIDRDGDGFGSGPGCRGKDCDDDDAASYPGAPELCNGIDNNCNGLADDNALGAGLPCDTGMQGVCADGWTACTQSNIVCQANVLPDTRREICNGRDDDCDGLVDEGPDTPEDANGNTVFGVGFPCGTPGDACFRGYQECDSATGILACNQDVEATNVPDVCDGVDNNCNGQIDEDANDPDGLLGRACSVGVSVCRGSGTYICNTNDPLAPPVCSAVERTGNAQAETCNYADDNCNGQVDEDFVNAAGVYYTAAHCGQCNTDCNTLFGDAAAKGIVPSCKLTGSDAACEFTCAANRFNLDKVNENGCEFEPDNQAIYVSTPVRGGIDSNTCGSFETPCATITRGITRAQAATKLRVRVSEGSFNESVTLINGISVLGGHSSVNWLRNSGVNVSTISGRKTDGPHASAVHIPATTTTTVFSGFTIDAPDANAGGNSYGIYVENGSNKLTISDNTILGGRGGAGSPGSAGTNGASGGDGGGGKARVNDRTSCTDSPTLLTGGTGATNTCGSVTTSGGAGANITQCPAETTYRDINGDGGAATSGSGTGRGSAGTSKQHTTPNSVSGGIYACNGGQGGTLTPGGNGANGASASAGAANTNILGVVTGLHWAGTTGGNGGTGTPAGGGGGGGSSYGIQDNAESRYHYGPTGGGGGAGGCGASGGTGGKSGGGSFGIFIAAVSSAPVITGNTINRGQGGRGGQGGLGGVGGTGGAGGSGGEMIVTTRWTRCGQAAAQGGTGGNGGHGGPGAGGNGGVSLGIAVKGSAPGAYASGNTFPATGAAGGIGGPGGGGITGNGPTGHAGESKPVHAY